MSLDRMKPVILPLDDAAELAAGDLVALRGELYTARDAAHQRLYRKLANSEPLPFPLAGATIYYCGPTPAPAGRPIGACGPTTSSRMDPYTPILLAHGLRAVIGKGPRSAETAAALARHHAVYFAAVGGAAAYLAQFVVSAEIAAYADLGPEAVYRLAVKDFPCVVAIDAKGGNIYS